MAEEKCTASKRLQIRGNFLGVSPTDAESSFCYFDTHLEGPNNYVITRRLRQLLRNPLIIGIGGYGYAFRTGDATKVSGSTTTVIKSSIKADIDDTVNEYHVLLELNKLRRLGVPNFPYGYGLLHSLPPFVYGTSANSAKILSWIADNHNYSTRRELLLMEAIQTRKTFYQSIFVEGFSEERADLFFIQLVNALYVAGREFQFNHGDLHTGNILIEEKPCVINILGEWYTFDFRVVIIDFGMSSYRRGETLINHNFYIGDQYQAYSPMSDIFKIVMILAKISKDYNEDVFRYLRKFYGLYIQTSVSDSLSVDPISKYDSFAAETLVSDEFSNVYRPDKIETLTKSLRRLRSNMDHYLNPRIVPAPKFNELIFNVNTGVKRDVTPLDISIAIESVQYEKSMSSNQKRAEIKKLKNVYGQIFQGLAVYYTSKFDFTSRLATPEMVKLSTGNHHPNSTVDVINGAFEEIHNSALFYDKRYADYILVSNVDDASKEMLDKFYRYLQLFIDDLERMQMEFVTRIQEFIKISRKGLVASTDANDTRRFETRIEYYQEILNAVDIELSLPMQ